MIVGSIIAGDQSHRSLLRSSFISDSTLTLSWKMKGGSPGFPRLFSAASDLLWANAKHEAPPAPNPMNKLPSQSAAYGFKLGRPQQVPERTKNSTWYSGSAGR